jgi:hypothetical protein
MLKRIVVPALLGWALLSGAIRAQVLIGGSINNGNLDITHATEIVPGFFLPTPNIWTHSATRTISGPTGDGISSEPWAGPAPTPVTTDGNLNPPPPDGYGGPDGGVFFKPFVGNATDGPVTIHLFQDVPGTAGKTYRMKGWAGAEANVLGTPVFALEFLNGSSNFIGGSQLDLTVAGLFVPNGQPFNYKEYTLEATAPAGTAFVRVRSSLLNGISNPAGGGQAFVVDDLSLAVPEPATAAVALTGALLVACRRVSRARPAQT